jgi:outer membrane lipoprotein LolB
LSIRKYFITTLQLCLLTSLISGCSLLRSPAPTPAPTINWVNHVRALTFFTDWHIKGKIGFKQPGNGGSAYIDWTQSNDSFHITLSGPLGQGATIISGNDSGARLDTASNGSFISETPEQLLSEHTGWYIPLSNLLYWVRGLPEPRIPAHKTLNASGLIGTMQQGQWQLSFDRYKSIFGQPLPHRIKMKSQGLTVTLLIKKWLPLDKPQP